MLSFLAVLVSELLAYPDVNGDYTAPLANAITQARRNAEAITFSLRTLVEEAMAFIGGRLSPEGLEQIRLFCTNPSALSIQLNYCREPRCYRIGDYYAQPFYSTEEMTVIIFVPLFFFFFLSDVFYVVVIFHNLSCTIFLVEEK